MPEGEDPIIVKPGEYPDPEDETKMRKGICFVIDDLEKWTIEEKDGKITITMASGDDWIVVPDRTPPDSIKRKGAILRVGMELSSVSMPGASKTGVNPDDRKKEMEIDYENAPPTLRPS